MPAAQTDDRPLGGDRGDGGGAGAACPLVATSSASSGSGRGGTEHPQNLFIANGTANVGNHLSFEIKQAYLFFFMVSAAGLLPLVRFHPVDKKLPAESGEKSFKNRERKRQRDRDK